tara:strand:+ start:96698 stop:96952 length:255 start_codon:yes stop_codon:yes gene_type:complete
MSSKIDSTPRATRLAQTIASDIAAYAQADTSLSSEAQREQIKQQIQEGREFFRSRVTPEVLSHGIYEEVVRSKFATSSAAPQPD